MKLSCKYIKGAFDRDSTVASGSVLWLHLPNGEKRILGKCDLTAFCRLVKLEKGAPTSSVPASEARSTFALVGAVGDGARAALGAGAGTSP
jgi:hypothetical protein